MFLPLWYRTSLDPFTRAIMIWYRIVAWKVGDTWNMKFFVFVLQFINSPECLGTFFPLQFLSTGFADVLRHTQFWFSSVHYLKVSEQSWKPKSSALIPAHSEYRSTAFFNFFFFFKICPCSSIPRQRNLFFFLYSAKKVDKNIRKLVVQSSSWPNVSQKEPEFGFFQIIKLICFNFPKPFFRLVIWRFKSFCCHFEEYRWKFTSSEYEECHFFDHFKRFHHFWLRH